MTMYMTVSGRPSEAEQAAKYGRKPGQIKVKDLNNDGSIDATNDRQIVGKERLVGQEDGITLSAIRIWNYLALSSPVWDSMCHKVPLHWMGATCNVS